MTPAIGIAVYSLNATEANFEYADYRWHIVLSPTAFDSPETRLYSVTWDAPRRRWYTSHRIAPLQSTPNLIGVLKISLLPNLPLRLSVLHEFIQQFPAKAEGYSTKGRGWSCTMYTVNILENLAEAGCIWLPCPVQGIIARGEESMKRLATAPATLKVLPL